MDPVFTVGHSNRSVEELLTLLLRHRIELLADVRRFPGSRRMPRFGADQLGPALADAGIDYEHVEALGGRRRADHDAPPEHGDAWRHPSFRAYAQHAQGAAYAHALDRLLEAAADQRTAIMCSEAVPWRCHRWLVSDTLVARGVPVVHLVGDGAPRRHQVSSFAHVEDGHVTWPGPPSTAKLVLGPPPDRLASPE